MRNFKFGLGAAAMVLLALGSFSCTREDVEVDNTPYTPKESAIYKHIADHKKERTRTGEAVKFGEVVIEDDSTNNK